MSDHHLQYPIGAYEPQDFSEPVKEAWLADIQYLPGLLEQAISNLDEEQLNTPYREGGWTVHQLIHHIADSHMNAYCRFKLGLTEHCPTIKTYDEKSWSALYDVKQVPVNISLTLLHALHTRWYSLLCALSDEDFQRKVFHPGYGRSVTLWFLLGSYAWHGRHHATHITSLRERKKW